MADPILGNAATIYAGGTSTGMVAEPTTDVGGTHTVYQITAATKRVLDPLTAVVVDSDGSPVDASLYTLDYFTGKVTFAIARGGAEVITFDANYIPKLAVAQCQTLNFKPEPVFADSAVFGDTAARKTKVRSGASFTIKSIEPPHTDLDSGAGSRILKTDLMAGTALYFELAPAPSVVVRGWFKPKSGQIENQLTDLASLTLEMEAVDVGGLCSVESYTS